MPADDGLTARAFTSSLVLNPPSSRLSVPPDVLRALRTYRTAVLRALGPAHEAERIWAEVGRAQLVEREGRAPVWVRPSEVAVEAARRIQRGVLGTGRGYTVERLRHDAELVQAPLNTARRTLGLGASFPSALLPREPPSPSPAPPASPHTPLSRRSTSPIPSPLRLRAPSTVTRFYAALLDHPSAPPGARTPPAVSSAYDALWAAAREAVTADVWDQMCRMRRADVSCATLALRALAAAKDAVVGRPPGRSIDARVQQIKSAQETIVNELVADALEAVEEKEPRGRRRSAGRGEGGLEGGSASI